MSQPRQIYLLDPKQLSPETIAVTFAKTSRSPQSFREIASELSDEKSANFNEKWVVGYGHSSVAEHAVLHIAVENISRLAVECLESNRLASYTEKSSRYQIWDLDHFFTPPEVIHTPFENSYTEICRRLFTNYQQAVSVVQDHLAKTSPQLPNESPAAFKQRLKTCCADVCRYYLPACSLANVGISINARTLEHALNKMLSHPLEEVRLIGNEIKQVSQANIPTLLKYADCNEYMLRVREEFSKDTCNAEASNLPPEDWLHVVSADDDGESRILAALLLRFGEYSYDQAFQKVQCLSGSEKEKLADDFLGCLGEHDIPERELEYAGVTVEVVLDQGAYFELKRHRMMTQTPQRFSARLGYTVPSLIRQAGLLDSFNADMEKTKSAYEDLFRFNPDVASYILPNAFNRRVLLDMNLRSALHFIKLRSAPSAHFAIRRVALRLAEEIRSKYPFFAGYFQPTTGETWESVTTGYFARCE
jgi:thymidylate synthase ThyX